MRKLFIKLRYEILCYVRAVWEDPHGALCGHCGWRPNFWYDDCGWFHVGRKPICGHCWHEQGHQLTGDR